MGGFLAQNLETPAEGVRASMVVVFAYLPIGFAAGVVGVGAGMSPMEIALLSLLVYAGSGQFVFASLLGGSALSLITTIFLINFRHFLYSAALSRRIKNLPIAARTAVGAQLTDETFAMMSVRRAPSVAAGMLTLNVSAYTAWFCGNIAGAITGTEVSAVDWGADFLLIAMFAGLLMLNVTAEKGGVKRRLAVAVVAAAVMVGLEHLASHALNIIAAAGLGAALGAMLEKGEKTAPNDL